MFSEQQIQIIKLLKAYKPLTLAEISKRLNLNKSSVQYQLEVLTGQKILEREQISAKKIKYKLGSKTKIEEYILHQKFVLEDLLMNKEIEGVDAYKELLKNVAFGESEIWGYANLERKIIPELMDTIEWYRDTISLKKRKDIFTITNTAENIALLQDHKRKELWKPWFIGRIIEKSIIDVNCDIYIWDGMVGICSFEQNKFKVVYYDDKATHDLLLSLLKLLFEQGKIEEDYYNAIQSLS